MATHTDASAAKTRPSTPPVQDTAPGFRSGEILARDGQQVGEAWKRLAATQEECARFWMQRAARHRQFYRRLGDCETPVEIWKLWRDAYRDAMHDYMDEASRLAEVARDPATSSANHRDAALH